MELPALSGAVKALGVRAMADWTAQQILLVSVFGIVAFASLVAALVAVMDARMRTKEMAADLEKALAELALQQEAASALERSLRCRDAFIDRNVLDVNGPEVFSAGSPEVDPKPARPSRLDDAGSDLFTVGSDEEGNDSGIGSDDGREDDESVCSVSNLSILHDENDGPAPRSPTAMSAVRIRPNDIKTVILRRPQAKGGRTQDQDEANQDAVAQWSPGGGNFAGDDAQCASEAHLRRPKPKMVEDEDAEELVKDQNPGDDAQHGVVPSRIDMYWLDNLIVSPRGRAKAARGWPTSRGRHHFCRGRWD